MARGREDKGCEGKVECGGGKVEFAKGRGRVVRREWFRWGGIEFGEGRLEVVEEELQQRVELTLKTIYLQQKITICFLNIFSIF